MQTPPVIIAARERRPFVNASIWAVVGVLLVLGGILFWYNPSTHGFYPRCWLYTNTGIYCPGCGSLRGLHQLAHGHVLTALRCNLPLMLSLPCFAVYAVRCARRWTSGQPLPPVLLRPAVMKALIVAMILFTILRNIPYAPFTLLTPP